jgi:dihydrofolate synthase/folylpolyglutamate synthase
LIDRLLARAAPADVARVPAPVRTAALLPAFARPAPGAVVKIAGTNGKGSVCSMMASCLTAAGYRVGIFTSPHLVHVSERIRVAPVPATTAELDDAADVVAERIETAVASLGPDYWPTYFERTLLLALEVFRRGRVDVAVLEAGVGGRTDAVSAVPGAVSAISSVALDHQAQLGDTDVEIAANKAGIATPGSLLVVAAGVDGRLVDTIAQACTARGVRLVQARAERVVALDSDLTGSTISVDWQGQWQTVRLALAGQHQIENAATSVAILDALANVGVALGPAAIEGLAHVAWPGRFELVDGAPPWVLDGAHNPHGLLALAATLDRCIPWEQRVLVCGLGVARTSAAVVERLAGLAPRIWVVDGFYGAIDGRHLAAAIGASAEAVGSAEQAVARAREEFAGSTHTIVACGSLYLVGALRACLQQRREPDRS